MNSIWKYELKLQDTPIELTMPRGTKILHVGLQHEVVRLGLQHEVVCLWALGNSSSEHVQVTRVIRMYGTGWPISEDILLGAYIGTVLTAEGQFVWHFFDAGERND